MNKWFIAVVIGLNVLQVLCVLYAAFALYRLINGV